MQAFVTFSYVYSYSQCRVVTTMYIKMCKFVQVLYRWLVREHNYRLLLIRLCFVLESSMFTPLTANVSANTSCIIPVTTKTVETTSTSTTMTSTAVIFNGISSTIMHSSSTTASGPNNREEGKIISYA